MTTRVLLRRLISKTQTLTTHHHHSFSTTTILRLRPLITAATLRHAAAVIPTSSRALSTCETTSSLNDQTDPNWKNRPPKEWILLDGCDFEHWFIFVEKPEGEPTRDEIIDSYINTLAKALGLSYDDARMKIYSVSTRYYFAFGALISEEDSDKLKVLPGVRWVLPDSYSDLENKQYDGEPFVDGKAVPYDPKYHEVWIRNHARAYKRQEKRKKLRERDEMKSDIEEDVEEDESDHSEEGYTFDDDDDDDGEFDKSDHAAAVIPTSSRAFSTCETTSSLNDPNPDWSNKLPKETILLDGCDFEHWLIVVEKPEGEPTRDEIIDSYINTLAKALGLSYDDARMKIYSVSTRCYYAFGALVSEEDSYKLKGLPGVRWVLPDSYLDVENKQYEGEPFIDGKAVPYDPKYHEEWIRENARRQLQESKRNRRNDKE